MLGRLRIAKCLTSAAVGDALRQVRCKSVAFLKHINQYLAHHPTSTGFNGVGECGFDEFAFTLTSTKQVFIFFASRTERAACSVTRCRLYTSIQ